ncbi:MAG: hypothetical protein IPP96_16650 [Chitinophagaceae bacterium]|nr:hypothetical protein [Chitinophagaceae bacterium]
MPGNKSSNYGRIFLVLSLAVLLFWVLSQVVDVYHFAFVGAVFEILWLPMLAALVILPVLSFIFWRNEKYNTRSLYFFSMLIVIATVLLMTFLTN